MSVRIGRAVGRLIAYRKGLYAANTVSWIVILLLELGAGYAAKLFFDALTGSAPMGFTVTGVIALVLGIGLVRVAAMLAGALLDIRHRFTMEVLLWGNLLRGILDQPGARSIPGSTGEALNTFRDDTMVVEDLLSWLIDQAAMVCYVAVALVILVRIDARITAIAVLPLLGVLLAARVVSKHIRRFREAARDTTERVAGAIGETMEGVETLQLAGAGEHAAAYVERLNRARLRAAVKDRLLSQSFHSFFWNAASLCTGLILLAAAGGLRAGTFSVGDFALFVIYVGVLTEFIAATGDFMIHFKQAGVSLRRMAKLIRDPDGARVTAHTPVHLRGPLPKAGRPALRDDERLRSMLVRGLSCRWPGDEAPCGRFELRDVALDVARGEFVVVTGRIGSGKTTLLRAILGLLPATEGEIRWNGQRVVRPDRFLVPPRCAYTPQVPQLFSESLRENILMGLEAADVDLASALRLAVLDQDVPQLQDGLETVVGAKGVKLSGGQRQRAAAARMFVREPELLVFDDLSSALDVETEALLWERLSGETSRTCLVVSHRRPALQRADRIVLLRDGQVDAVGRLEELLEVSEEMRCLWRGTLTDAA